jgi:integrase
MKVKLTDTGIRSYQPRAVQYAIGDSACPGLCLRITPKGVKTFAFAYRNKGTGKVAWLTLGRYPDVPLGQARELTNDARKTVAAGAIPLAAKARHVEVERQGMTYAKLVELYYDAHLSTLRTGHATRTSLQRIGRVYGWNERPVASITDDEAAIMLADIAIRRGKKANANQTKHILHGMFKWAKQPGRKFVTINPFADLPAPGGTIKPRDRFLSADEIRQLWRALDDPQSLGIKPDAATALRLILVTAARPGMARGIVGSELRDLVGPSLHGPNWTLPAERMKAKSAFITPLSTLAQELIRPHLKTDPAAPLFDLPRYYLDHAAKLIVAGLGMKRWTPHDLRRTAATILDRAGYSREQIGAILAHTRKGVTAVYARWDKFDLRREMAMVVEQSLRETLNDEPSEAVRAAA